MHLKSSVKLFLIGGNGYLGQKMRGTLDSSLIDYFCPKFDALNKEILEIFLDDYRPTHVLNFAGYTGKPNVDACELNKEECWTKNVLLPKTLAEACKRKGVILGHVSSGCIYNNGNFSENDKPNFSGSFYSKSKAAGEKELEGLSQKYIWRIRMPFDSEDSPRNLLVKLNSYRRLVNALNSITHTEEFCQAVLDCIENNLPYGTYNLVNPNPITTKEATEIMGKYTGKTYRFYPSIESFQRKVLTPRSNCTLSSNKAIGEGLCLTDTATLIDHECQKLFLCKK